MALVYTPRPYPVMAQAAIDWVFSSKMQVQVAPLSPELFAWVTKDGAEFADRWDFTWKGEADEIHGSLMFLTSNTWRGQHRPERCFEVQGITVETYQTVFFDDEFSAQMVLVSGGRNRPRRCIGSKLANAPPMISLPASGQTWVLSASPGSW